MKEQDAAHSFDKEILEKLSLEYVNINAMYLLELIDKL